MRQSPYRTKPGTHGTLYLWTFVYTDDGDRGCSDFRGNTWAYDREHAVENFHNTDDDGWKLLKLFKAKAA